MVVERLKFFLGLNLGIEAPHLSVENLNAHLFNEFLVLLHRVTAELVNGKKTLVKACDMLSLDIVFEIFIENPIELDCEDLFV